MKALYNILKICFANVYRVMFALGIVLMIAIAMFKTIIEDLVRL